MAVQDDGLTVPESFRAEQRWTSETAREVVGEEGRGDTDLSADSAISLSLSVF